MVVVKSPLKKSTLVKKQANQQHQPKHQIVITAIHYLVNNIKLVGKLDAQRCSKPRNRYADNHYQYYSCKIEIKYHLNQIIPRSYT